MKAGPRTPSRRRAPALVETSERKRQQPVQSAAPDSTERARTGQSDRVTAEAGRAIRDHVRRFFEGHEVDMAEPVPGSVRDRVPDFDVLRVAPGPRVRAWAYVSTGCWQAAHAQ